jgi:hypothetical protein
METKMSKETRMYKILGSDGNEYDSISAEQIRQWIREGRVEKKTPAMSEGADDWIFLSDLKEFAETFASVQKSDLAVSDKNRRMRKAGYIGLCLVAVVITAFFILKKMKYH